MTSTAFHALHAPDAGLLILPNAWDAGSARLIESLGARAIATTSAGVAWAQGYPDGDALPVDRLLAVTESIARVVSVPLSVDAEGGYSDNPREVAELGRRLRDAGAAGVNLEDGGGDQIRLADKIAAVKAAAPDLFINGRTDVWLRGLGAPESRVGEALERARVYEEAGADGLFCPGVSATADIEALVGGTSLPLNVMALPRLGSAEQLASLGVRRLSAGSGLAGVVLAVVAERTRAFLADGDSTALTEGMLSYSETQALFST